ncbi:MAG TPA: LLM class flavin-dependent oxidoreductase [Candidatus Dormibacteraeota bacterium]|nr:LLM class flavin-dependent oxidoreductase [Candidatus Dormibacteraeota bacterium]
MDVGVGLDGRLGLGMRELRELAQDAVALGYTSVWTPNATLDPFILCALWWESARVATGISVLPVPLAGPAATLARSAATVADMCGGRFILGIGSGSPDRGAVARTRRELRAIRAALAGKAPVYLAALGPRMLALAASEAEGVALNWCSAAHVAWSRARVEEAAASAGRDPAGTPLVEYVRVCVDDDEDAARLAIARQVVAYALARPGQSKAVGYRAHFTRMGFGDALDELEARRDRGADAETLARAVPLEMLREVAAFGPAARVREGFLRLARGLDLAIVRVIAARPGLDAARAAMVACRPEVRTPASRSP